MNSNWPSAIVYLILVGVLALAGARYAASNYFAQAAIRSGSIDEAATAVSFQTGNPGAHEALGIELLQRNEFVAASDAFEKAILLSPNDYRLCLRLAQARLLSGDAESAKSAYSRAIELAPRYSLPYIELGRVYLGLGQRDKAFEFLAAAARLDQSYYAEVLRSANAAFGDDPEAIERAVAPVSPKGKSIVAWYFMDRSWMTEKAREFLLSDESTTDEKNTVIRFLKEKRKYRLARDVWFSRLAGEGITASEADVIFDGGFESLTESDPSGLGWQIDQEVPFTSITRDAHDVHSGRVALNIRFGGNVDLRRPLVSQIAFIDPGKSYTLTFFIRTGKLVSAGLPALLVTDPATNAIVGRSEPIEDSKGTWLRQSVTFTSPNEPAVLISLQRPACESQPCPIFGEISIDDFSITPTTP